MDGKYDEIARLGAATLGVKVGDRVDVEVGTEVGAGDGAGERTNERIGERAGEGVDVGEAEEVGVGDAVSIIYEREATP